MADTKITALAAITTVDPAADVLPIVDISDTSMAASGTTKKITSNQILGAGGTATLASATITGDLTVDTNVLKVDTTNNRVGIGTATPGFPLHVQSATAVFKLESSTGTNPAYLYTTSTGGDFYFGRDNSTGTTFGTGTGYSAVLYSANAYPMVFFTNAIERARITSSGDVNISTGNLVMGTSGKGIDFSATANSGGTMTSELLNDYEEGTFTPTVVGSSTVGSATYATQIGRYVKIGRQVTAWVHLEWSGGTGTGNLRFGGLPFNIVTLGSNNFPSASIGYISNIALSANNIAVAYGQNAENNVNLGQYPVGGGTGASVAYDTAGQIIFTITYEV